MATGKGGIPAPERTTVRTSREVPDETPAGTMTGCQDQTDLKGGKAAPEPRQRGGVVMADQAVCSRPVFFPFRSADVGCPKPPRRVPETAPEKQN